MHGESSRPGWAEEAVDWEQLGPLITFLLSDDARVDQAGDKQQPQFMCDMSGDDAQVDRAPEGDLAQQRQPQASEERMPMAEENSEAGLIAPVEAVSEAVPAQAAANAHKEAGKAEATAGASKLAQAAPTATSSAATKKGRAPARKRKTAATKTTRAARAGKRVKRALLKGPCDMPGCPNPDKTTLNKVGQARSHRAPTLSAQEPQLGHRRLTQPEAAWLRALQGYDRWFSTANFNSASVQEQCENHKPPIRILCEACKNWCTDRKGNSAHKFFFRLTKGNEGVSCQAGK